MRRVIMKTVAAGPDGVMHSGDTYLLDEKMAKGLVAGGYAEYETSVVGPVEIAGKTPDLEEIKKVKEASQPAPVAKPVSQPAATEKPLWGAK